MGRLERMAAEMSGDEYRERAAEAARPDVAGRLAGELGLEPRPADSKSAHLPLVYSPPINGRWGGLRTRDLGLMGPALLPSELPSVQESMTSTTTDSSG
jgi:hypothetical protein